MNVVNTDIENRDILVEAVVNAATSSVANETEAFIVTPTKADRKMVIEFTNASGNGDYTYSIEKGTLWAADSAKAFTGTVPAGKTSIIMLEGAKHLNGGKYNITLTPATGKRLSTDHVATITAIETV